MFFAELRGSFAARVSLVFAAMLLAVATVLGWFFAWSGTRRLEAELLERGRVIAEILATGARTAVYSENPALVRDVLAGVAEKREVLAAAVFAGEGAPLAVEGRNAGARTAAGQLAGPARAALGALAAGGGCVTPPAGAGLEILCPVVLRRSDPGPVELFFDPAAIPTGAEVIGHVRVVLDRGPLREATARFVARAVALTVALLVAGLLLVLFLAHRAAEPLTRLTEQVHALGEAGAAREIAVARHDEIGRLAAAFNAMLRSLAERAREKEQLEERLQGARRMEAVGSLSRGIAHDFNNILSTVTTAVHILERASPGNELVREYAGRIRISLGRARELIERLMTFSRAKPPELRPVDLGATVRDLAPMLREAAGDATEVVLDVPPAPVPVVADPEGIRQVLLNLCYNARDAMPGGGVLRVGVSAEAPAGAAAPPAARIMVSDSGTGMERAVRERIFEPFYSTKEVGRGTGLGLAIVHGIVEQHRGRIEVLSEPGRGTSFLIDLPLAPPAGAPGGGS